MLSRVVALLVLIALLRESRRAALGEPRLAHIEILSVLENYEVSSLQDLLYVLLALVP